MEQSFTDFIQEMAAEMAIDVQSESQVIVPFNMDNGRTQLVWVEPLGTDSWGNTLVSFVSPAIMINSGEMLNVELANRLLRQNAEMAHGAWSIQEMPDGDFVVAFDILTAESMQPRDFEATVRVLSLAADALEEELGTDDF